MPLTASDGAPTQNGGIRRCQSFMPSRIGCPESEHFCVSKRARLGEERTGFEGCVNFTFA
jgi:hypothetical protein